MKVEIGGREVEIEDEATAQAIIEGRDALKQSRRSLEDRLAKVEQQAEATRAEAEAKAREAEEAAARAAAVEAAKKGDIEEATRLLTERLTSDHRKTVDQLTTALKTQSLKSMLAQRGDLMPEAINDALALLDRSVAYQDGAIIPVDQAGQPVTDSAGKPVPVDAWLGSWLEAKPYLRADRTPPGSGAKPAAASPGPRTITRAQYDPTDRDQAAGIVSGQIKITD